MTWPAWARGVLEAMRSLPNVSAAAKSAGVGRRTVYDLIQRDESFALALDDARREGLDSLEAAIVLRAGSSVPTKKVVTETYPDGKQKTTVTEESHISDLLAMFILKRWRPEYRDNFKLEHSGPNGAPIKFDIGKVDAEIRQASTNLACLALSVAAVSVRGACSVIEVRLACGTVCNAIPAGFRRSA